MRRHRSVMILVLVFSLSMMIPGISHSQDSSHQMDLQDWLVQKKILKKKSEQNSFLIIIPVLASNPTAGFIFGAGMSYTYKTRPSDTKLSTINSSGTYSTNGLVNLNIKTNVFALNEELVLNGDWRYLVNSEKTHGLGSADYPDSIAQDLKFSQVRIHETLSWQLFRNFYAGIGFQFDARFSIKDYTAEEGDSAHSFHYQYSKKNDFDPSDYIVSGLGLNLLLDSRDNQVNAYRGYYANANYLVNREAFGSTKNSSLLLTEFRSYYSLDKKKRGHVLAFWLYGNFLIEGDAPYLALPGIGNDQRQRSGRGYPFSTFRGQEMVYGEAEYRFPISVKTGILGGVIFLNAVSTSDRSADTRVFQYIQPAYGAGLRIMLEKKSRTRLEIDAALSGQKAGFYFGVQETF